MEKLGKKTFAICLFGLLALSMDSVFAFGERGCTTRPHENKGVCNKNTEDVWKCSLTSVLPDCISSND